MCKNYYLQNLINNLADYGLTFDEFKTNFKYAGGDTDRHNRYFKLCYREEDRPAYCNYCLCDHYIEENCYVTDGNQFMVLGNCCIKKFMPKCTRTCEDCGKPHKSRKVNKCTDCKFGKCDNCGKRCKKENIMCLTCSRMFRPCMKCSKLIERPKYICEECRICVKCGGENRNIIINICTLCKDGRECEKCGKLHLNKIVNRCDTCRVGVCDECGKKCRPCFEKCYTCAYLKNNYFTNNI